MKLHWILPLLLLLSACEEKAPPANAQWGTPEFIATEFFDALYNDKDLEKAKKLSTPKYAALMEAYGTPRQVVRTMFNMPFDAVTISVNRAGQNLREQYEEEAEVTLVFSGPHNGEQVAEMRVVTMTKYKGKWVVQNVKVDKFSKTEV